MEFLESHFLFICSCCYAAFLLVGMVFYKYSEDWDWGYSFYYAVNVGVSIGFNVPTRESESSQIFTIFYMILGVLGFGLILLWITTVALSRKARWYKFLLVERALEKKDTEIIEWIWLYYMDHFYACNIAFVLIFIVTVGVLFYYYYVEFDVINSFYFVAGCITTAGLLSIPDDSEDWVYGFTGLYTALAAMVFAVCFFYQIFVVLMYEKKSKAEQALESKVTVQELEILRDMGLEEHEGCMDKREFLLLIIMRMELIDAELVEQVYRVFDELDVRKSGSVPLTTMMKSSRRRTVDIGRGIIDDEIDPLLSRPLSSRRDSVKDIIMELGDDSSSNIDDDEDLDAVALIDPNTPIKGSEGGFFSSLFSSSFTTNIPSKEGLDGGVSVEQGDSSLESGKDSLKDDVTHSSKPNNRRSKFLSDKPSDAIPSEDSKRGSEAETLRPFLVKQRSRSSSKSLEAPIPAPALSKLFDSYKEKDVSSPRRREASLTANETTDDQLGPTVNDSSKPVKSSLTNYGSTYNIDKDNF